MFRALKKAKGGQIKNAVGAVLSAKTVSIPSDVMTEVKTIRKTETAVKLRYLVRFCSC